MGPPMKTLIETIKTLSQPLELLRTAAPVQLNALQGVETILFDIYGTLIISGSGDIGTATTIDDSEALIQSLIVSGFEGDHERAGELGPELLHAQIKHWHKSAHESGVDFPEIEISQIWRKVIERLQTDCQAGYCRLYLA